MTPLAVRPIQTQVLNQIIRVRSAVEAPQVEVVPLVNTGMCRPGVPRGIAPRAQLLRHRAQLAPPVITWKGAHVYLIRLRFVLLANTGMERVV